MAQAKYKKWLDDDNLIKITAWARDGLTEEQISHNMGISLTTLKEWKKKYQAIATALKKGKEVIDFEVENALLKRALGYETSEEKIVIRDFDGKVFKEKTITKKSVPPDTTAQIFWLKNRKPDYWRDKKLSTRDRQVQSLDMEKARVEIEKARVEIEKLRAQTDQIKGIAEEIEDLSEIEADIYGKD